MPGVVTMDHGGPEASRTDHDTSLKANGVNGTSNDASHNQPTKEAATHPSDSLERSALYPSRMNDLPDEIVHITQGFIPLSALLTRLAQSTHNSLQDAIIEIAKMPVPAAAMNGNVAHSSTSDDSSAENIRKKAALLNFAQDHHAKWVKALVITEWSRKTDKVSKLIDLKFHIDQQRMLYDAAVDNMVNLKRDLTYARMPSPDLKTALQILSTGSAPWMPDLQYIEPPPLTLEEQLKWINDLNTLLSLRLNLDEFDKIPPQFRDYEIESGRVKFKVRGEFEVDLTIADEDFEKQFWFIDFRFDFKPATSTLSDSLRAFLEACVNDALSKDGLPGCYQFLHEYVLTCKINELKRQAIQMSKKSWTGTLIVEPLQRSLAIQYWTSRTQGQGPKSWVLIGVNSGRNTTQTGGKPTSHLVMKWYRDNKEVESSEISLDDQTLSAQNLLRSVIGKHVEFILRNIHDKLLGASRFKNRQAGMVLEISKSDPTRSALTTQVGYQSHASLLIEPRTGSFVLKPHSKFTIQFEHQLNNGRNQIEDGVLSLENVRCAFIEDEVHRTGSGAGWHACRPRLTSEEIKHLTRKKDWTKALWLQQNGWSADWVIVVLLSPAGDEWWLVDTSLRGTRPGQHFHARLPLNKGHPSLNNQFWYRLTFLTTGMVAQSVDLRELHQRKIHNRLMKMPIPGITSRIGMPVVTFKLSTMFPEMVFQAKESRGSAPNTAPSPSERFTATMSLSSKQPWANDQVVIDFQGLQTPRAGQGVVDDGSPQHQPFICVSDAIISVRNPAKLRTLNRRIDRDVSYAASIGTFRVRMRYPVGVSALPILKSRIKAIDRVVSFLEALDEAKGTITRDSTTLSEVSCFYNAPTRDASASDGVDTESPAVHRWRVVMDLSGDTISVKLEKGNPHLRVIDLIDKLANLDGGIKVSMIWLPSSLPALVAVNDIESQWEEIDAQKGGRLEFFMRALDWMSIFYTLYGTDPSGQRIVRQLKLECRLRLHRNEPWWHINRLEENGVEDDFTAALKPIWEGKGVDWQGLSTGAAGKLSGGVATMLQEVDQAIRAMVGTIDGHQASFTTTIQGASQSFTQTSLQSTSTPATQPNFSQKKAGKGASKPITID